MVIVLRDVVVNIDDAEELILEGKVKYHRFWGRDGVSNMVNDRKGTCQIEFDIDSNVNHIGVSKGW